MEEKGCIGVVMRMQHSVKKWFQKENGSKATFCCSANKMLALQQGNKMRKMNEMEAIPRKFKYFSINL